MADKKEHTYPKTKSTEMSKANNNVLGDSKKQTTDAGPHLKQGKGNPFQQAKLGKGFLTQESRPGHKQKKNIESDVS